MNITFNKICGNAYQIISDKLSQLNPLQKKVALLVMAYLSLATLGYLIYSCYSFQGRRKEEENFEEDKKIKKVISPVISLKKEESTDSDVREKTENIEKSGEDEKTLVIEKEKEEENLYDEIEEDTLSKIDAFIDSPLKDLKPLTIENCELLGMDAIATLPKGLKPLNLDFTKELFLKTLETTPPSFRNVFNQLQLDKNKKEARLQQDKEVSKGFDISKHDAWKKPVLSPSPTCLRSGREYSYNTYTRDYCCIFSISFMAGAKIYSGDLFASFEVFQDDEKPIPFLRENLEKYLGMALAKHNVSELTPLGICDAITESWEELNKNIPPGLLKGIAGSINLILEDHIWVASLGGNRTLLIKDGKTTKASVDQPPSIYSGLKLNPAITCYPLKDFQGGYLVALGEGFFKHASSDEIGNAIQILVNEKKSIKEIVNTLLSVPGLDNGNVLMTQL